MSIIEQYLTQAESLYQSENFASARIYARKVIKRDDSNVTGLTLLGLINLHQQQFIEAEACLLKANQLSPNSVSILSGLLTIAESKEDFFLALKYLLRIIEIEPEDSQYRYKLGLVANEVGNLSLAEQCFEWCVSHEVKEPAVQLNLCHIHKAKGNTDTAADYYKQYINLSDKQFGVGYWSLADLKQYQFTDFDIAKLEDCAKDDTLGVQNKSLIQFALCKAYEQRQQIDKACQSMLLANKLMSANRPFKQALFSRLVFSLLKHVPSPHISQLTKAEQTPIFIVGMPRSGTTLVEQILACHSKVGATDELPFMERFALQLEMSGSYLSRLNQLSVQEIEMLRNQYLTEANNYFNDLPSYIIDKNPNNFLHIGLIKTLFPDAKIINVVRNTVDNGLSVFKQFFSFGHDYSYSLDSINLYWQHYLDIMKHWNALYADDILDVCFEQLVREPDSQIQSILEYCHLDIEPQCFRFYESKRAVLTPSSSQVRQPMNTKAIGQGDKYKPYIAQQIVELEMIAAKATKQFFG